jgi:hypothetical protein
LFLHPLCDHSFFYYGKLREFSLFCKGIDK